MLRTLMQLEGDDDRPIDEYPPVWKYPLFPSRMDDDEDALHSRASYLHKSRVSFHDNEHGRLLRSQRLAWVLEEEDSHGNQRVPSPMPTFLNFPPPGGRCHRMSRQSKGGGTLSPSSSCGSDGSRGSGIPVPVVQQAQQYLEANIKAWMQPSSSPSRSREEMPPLPLLNMTSTAETYSAYHHTLSRGINSGASTSGITHQALAEHNIALQHQHHPRPPHPRVPPPLTSPSSGYSEHSDPYLSLSLAGACDSSGGPSMLSSKTAFPHSLSFSGCSNHSLLQETSYSSPCGNSFGIAQPSAAASFFARAAQRLNLSTKKKRRVHPPADPERPIFRTNFSEVIKLHPPPVPPGLLRISGRKDGAGIGKVKVMLRICPTNEAVSSADSSYMNVDSKKKQLTLYDPTICGPETSEDRHGGVPSPKMFAFDAVFSPDDNQAEVCSSSLCDVISSVVGGNDGCLFVYGHSKLGKTTTMIGNSNFVQELGVIPCAIWWLFRAINEQKHRTGARFSVRVSAVEVSGKVEELRDLLSDYAAGAEGSGPGVYLNDDPVFGTQLMNHSELRAPTAERATYLLDAALAARTPECDEDSRNAHFLFTLHVYQYRVEKGGRGGVAGGRSRLHLFDLGSCEKMSKSRDCGSGGCLSLSALGNVILALFNGQKHVPYKDSKLTQLLKEALGSVTCRAAMIAHVSSAPARYPETLSTLQLASRIHRLRRKKLKFPTTTEVPTTSENRGVCRPFVRLHAVGEDGVVRSGSSDPDYTSSSEQSCDTVIFVGTGRGTPVPDHGAERHHVPSPLAKENRNASGQNNQTLPTTHKKQVPKIHSSGQPQPVKESFTTPNASTSASKEDKSLEGVKSALNLPEKIKSNVSASPKKKASSSAVHSSPKHIRTNDNVTNASNPSSCSPKPSKYAMIDYSGDMKKSAHSAETLSKGSPSRSSKNIGAEQFQKVSATASFPSHSATPHSPRKSKRVHKQESSSSSLQSNFQQLASSSHQQSKSTSGGSPKLPAKELKVTSDETWIDGPRFTKPKFDSRTLHQLQKEKWVDGPGMYGYMDVHKETMIRRWVEDHSRHVDEETTDRQQEVWIDFPPNIEDKSLLKGILEKYVPSDAPSDKSCIPSQTDVSKKDPKSTISDKPTEQVVVEVETHHYAKPNVKKKQSANTDSAVLERNCSRDGDAHVSRNPNDHDNFPRSSNPRLDNTGNAHATSHQDTGSSKTSDENSNCSTDFNDNESDLANQECEISDSAKSKEQIITNRFLSCDPSEEFRITTVPDNGDTEESVVMVDCCIQVNEEDIFMTCGWPDDTELPPESYIQIEDSDIFEHIEHPLRILSAEDLNLASTFSDSRTVSIDLDSISVPETWKYSTDDLDPNLTWRLLKGNSFPKKCPERLHNHSEMLSTNKELDLILRGDTFVSRLNHLSRLRGLMQGTPSTQEVQSSANSQIFNSLSCRENRLILSNKMHHSADSSLEELRENDNNSIHSEPAELDIEKLEFQFNIKPMNGLRLEAFYNRIHKVPLFPECIPQFGKPTQVVPPIVKQESRHSPVPKDDLKSMRNTFRNSKEKLDREEKQGSPSRQRKRWSGLSKTSEYTTDLEPSQKSTSQHQISTSSANSTVQHQSSPSNASTLVENAGQLETPKLSLQTETSVSRESLERIQSDNRRRSLTEIILEQRCLTYSEGLSSPSPVPVHHASRHALNRKPQKSGKGVFESPLNVCRTADGSDQRHDNIPYKQYQRKKGSPKLPPRSSVLNSSSKNGQNRSSKQHHSSCVTSVPTTNPSPQQAFDPVLSSPGAQTGVSSSVSWTHSPSGGGAINSSYVMQSHYDSSDLAQVHRNHILSRSSSTPTSPFMNSSGTPHMCAQSESTVSNVNCPYTCSGPTLKTSLKGAPPKVESSKWSKRQSSSGHGSDSSVISADIKESKELLGKFPKAPQFSGTSSGYESMPRDSEGTPLSSSSQESSSEVGSKREMRGRKGTRKKSQGSGKRSRSVPARAPVTSSPTWQPLPAPLSRQPVRGRGRLVRDIHDPSLWKSEEDVCCTSLLCCRLLDFY